MFDAINNWFTAMFGSQAQFMFVFIVAMFIACLVLIPWAWHYGKKRNEYLDSLSGTELDDYVKREMLKEARKANSNMNVLNNNSNLWK